METPEIKDLTEDQKKEIGKAIAKMRWSLLWLGFRFVGLLFLANIVSIVIGILLLKDNLDALQKFQTFCLVINFIFMIVYLDKGLKAKQKEVSDKIKEILKK